VVVTGASSGIGAATARRAAAAGARVGLVARRAEVVADLAAELGGRAVAADVTDADAVSAAVDELAATLDPDRAPGLEALVAAAGTMTLGAVADTDPRRWQEILEVNVLGVLTSARAALAHLGADGTIVLVSSMSGRRVPSAPGGVYAASKHAVHAVADTLRLEAGPRGVRVTTVAPGFVATDLMADEGEREDVARFRGRMHEQGLAPDDVARGIEHVLGLPSGVTVVEYALVSTRQQ
jgi:NADP-dependent 3-hydroxy acid dehydrogenase YdfG